MRGHMVLVTGAARGIGREVARQLGAAGRDGDPRRAGRRRGERGIRGAVP